MRILAADERAILERLAQFDDVNGPTLRLQIEAITGVSASCSCGCPTVAIVVDRSAAPPIDRLDVNLLPWELFEGERSDGGVPRQVCAFVEDGYIDELECVCNGDPEPSWPPLDRCLVSRTAWTDVVLPSDVRLESSPGQAHLIGDRVRVITHDGFFEWYGLHGVLQSREQIKPPQGV